MAATARRPPAGLLGTRFESALRADQGPEAQRRKIASRAHAPHDRGRADAVGLVSGIWAQAGVDLARPVRAGLQDLGRRRHALCDANRAEPLDTESAAVSTGLPGCVLCRPACEQVHPLVAEGAP